MIRSDARKRGAEQHHTHHDPAVRQLITEAEQRGARQALRAFADTRGVNIGTEDDEWWRGYRQAQRECLRDACDAAHEAVEQVTP